MSDTSQNSIYILRQVAESIYKQLEKRQFPKIEIPQRTSSNVKLTKEGLVLADKKIIKSSSKVSTVKSFAQLCWLNYFACKLVESGKTTTLRDIYYSAQAYKDIMFKEQVESNRIVEDLEAITGLTREQFNIYPKQRAVIFGDLKFKYITPKPHIKNPNKIYELDEHPDGYVIGPELTNNAEFFECNADKIIVAEKQAVFQRFIEEKVYEKFNALLVFTEGQPPRNCRLLVRKLSEQFNLPVYVLTDSDPWGLQIFLTLKYNSSNLAHVRNLNVPKAKWIGVYAEDITKYKLPTVKMTDKDLKKAKNMLTNDIRCKSNKFFIEQLKLWLKMKRKCELEAFSRYGLSFICDVYLKEKLAIS